MKLSSLKVLPRDPRDYVKGFLTSSVVYESRNKSGNWEPYFGQYEGQKYWVWDTSCCWAWAGLESIEDQLEFLWKTGKISQSTKTWFVDNGYIDEDGDFYFSRRFIPVLSGVKNAGNGQQEFWRLASKHGLIPNAMLPYSVTRADNFSTEQDFVNDYFNPAVITQEMRDLGQAFLEHVKIEYEWVGGQLVQPDNIVLESALKQAPLQIGVPVIWDWNQPKLKWDGSKQVRHSVELYKYDNETEPEYPYYIYDQYEPHLKQLSSDYFIGLVTNGVINVKNPPVVTVPVKETIWDKVFKAVYEWYRRNWAIKDWRAWT